MVAKKEEGQSVVEFLLMLPILIGMTVILTKINTAIQISIVNQQYARAQTHFLTYNSPYYPTLRKQQRLIETSSNQLVVGVSDNAAGGSDTKYVPKATVQSIARSRRVVGSDAAKEEPTQRAKVRIRNTVTLCTQTLTVPTRSGTAPLLQVASAGGAMMNAVGVSNLNESTVFSNMCGSAMKYEQ